jgi:hypothetical protein
MKEKLKTFLAYVLQGFAVTVVLYAVAATVCIRIQRPDFTESQILIKMFVWDYEGE